MKRILFSIALWLFSSCLFAFTLSSPEFDQNGPIPRIYTCQGRNISPPLVWKNPPIRTESYLLVMADLDTQKTHGFSLIHWVVFDISKDLLGLRSNNIVGRMGMNGKNESRYQGPCPPAGVGPHHYLFQLYALDIPFLELSQGASLEEVDEVSKGHIIGKASLVGTYTHSN